MTRSAAYEKNGRIAAMDRARKKAGFDYLLLSDPVAVAYACGFVASNAMVLLGRKKMMLFTDSRYQYAAEQFHRKNPDWNIVIVNEQIGTELAPYLPAGSLVGFQSDRMVVDEYARMKKRLRGRRFTGCAARLEPLFMVKQPSELSAMRKAARIGDAAFKKLLPHIVPGVSELELVRKLEAFCSEQGSGKPSFDTIVLFGKRSALPHGRPGTSRLKRGMFVLIDFGCTVDGFASDMTRTVVCGEATDRQRSLYRTVYAAQRQARMKARAGMTANSIDALARDLIEKAGYGSAFGHALGHGVGRMIHEPPRISFRVTERVPAGAVVTIEPGIYLPDLGGVRIEDMVVLRRDGNSLLTHSSRELMEL